MAVQFKTKRKILYTPIVSKLDVPCFLLVPQIAHTHPSASGHYFPLPSTVRVQYLDNKKRLLLGSVNQGFFQGSKRIRQWPIDWCTSPMMIHKIASSVDYNYGWNVWILNIMNQLIKIQEKSQKLLSQRIRKRYYN